MADNTTINDTQSFDGYTNILFINKILDTTTNPFQSYCNSTTFPIVYDSNSTRDDVKTTLSKFTNIKRIAFAFHGPSADIDFYTPAHFLNGEDLFQENDLVTEKPADFSQNITFIKELIQLFSLENMDFLGCNLLKHNEWKSYFELLKQNSSLIVGASNDDTGNIKYGGDWVMENTMEDIKNVYFNDTLDNYANLLAAAIIDGIYYNLVGTDATVKEWPGHTGDIVIPPTVTYQSVTYNVIAIGEKSFLNASITSIFIPNTITTIARYVFYFMNLTSITFQPNSQLTTIADHAFHITTAPSIEIPKSVTSIELNAFNGFVGIITFEPGSLPLTLGASAFMGLGVGNVDFTIPSRLTYVPAFMLESSLYLETVTFEKGSTMESIATRAFSNCQKLREVINIPDTVSVIVDKAFDNTLKLKKCVLPKNLTELRLWTFRSSGINVLSIPPTILSLPIDNRIFDGSSLNTMYIDSYTANRIGVIVAPNQLISKKSGINVISWVFTVTDGKATLGDGSDTDGNATSFGTAVTGFLPLPKSVADADGIIYDVVGIGKKAFSNCTSLTSFFLPDSVTTIGESAFSGCTGLEEFTTSESVTLGANAFKNTAYVSPIIPPSGDVSVADIKNTVPIVIDDGSGIISVPIAEGSKVLVSGTKSDQIEKRNIFFKEFFNKNSATVAGKTIKMDKEVLLGTTSVISKPSLQIMQASNTETPIDTSSLGSDEGIYAFIDNVGDFIVLEMGVGKKLKVEKKNDTEYNIYEDYVDSSTPITLVMSEGQTNSYNDFGYQIGSFVGPTDPELLPVPICFPGGTPVTTDQGEVLIEKLKPSVHTIRGKPIVAITETVPNFRHMVCIEKDAFGKNSPSVRTEISPDHRILYNGKMMKSDELTTLCQGVKRIPYYKEKLYNVLMEQHDTMKVNNLICETLHPNNLLVKIATSKYSNSIKMKLYNEYEALLIKQSKKASSKLVSNKMK